MGWARRNFMKTIFVSLVFTLLSLWGATGMESNKSTSSNEDENMLSKNLCDYAITDFEEIKPKVLALFPVGMNEEDARKQLAEFPSTAYKGIRLYEQFLPKIGDDGFVFESENKVLMSTAAKLIGIFFECPLRDENKNNWSLVIQIDEGRNLVFTDFYTSIDDMNFAKRNIELKAEYISGNGPLVKAIYSIVMSEFSDWGSLKKYLTTNGFDVSEVYNENDNSIFYRVEVNTNPEGRLTRIEGDGKALAIVDVDGSNNVTSVSYSNLILYTT